MAENGERSTVNLAVNSPLPWQPAVGVAVCPPLRLETRKTTESHLNSILSYVALGGSMSMDEYPAADLAQSTGVTYRGAGAASLLYRNNNDLWPEFRGMDLVSREYRSLEILCEDEARVPDVLEHQAPRLNEDITLITLTIGGRDLIHALGNMRSIDALFVAENQLEEDYEKLVQEIHARARRAMIVCTTVYDPTDGTGRLQKGGPVLPIDVLKQFNDFVRAFSGKHNYLRLADAEKHMLGHGVTAEGEDHWYWSGSIIEPSARGASEIRRVWLEAIGETQQSSDTSRARTPRAVRNFGDSRTRTG
jgi:hypothetical protein